MCSIVDGSLDQGALSEKKIPIDVANSICKKCREAKSVLCLRVKDTYCKECFLTSSTHKFRSTLGKHKVMRPGDQVLIGFSGNQGSLALLHLNSAGLDEANQKRLLFESKILIIDETGPFLDDPNARLEHTRSLSQLASKFSFPVHITSLEYVLLNGETDVHPMKIFKAPEEEYELPPKSLTEELKNLFNKTKEASAKEALIHNLKRKLLVDLAPVLGCKKIFTAECSTSLAVTLMSGIATGRGIQLPYDAGFLDPRVKDITIIRPMREFSSTEIHLFNSFQDVKDPIQTPSFGAGQDSLFSIEKLTEDFITGLQNDFPATIPTIFRTGDKFHVTKDTLADLHEIDNACLMCQGILDTQTVNPCSLQATKFSQMVSLKGPENLKENQLLSAAIVKLNLDDLSASSGKGETVENGCEKEKSSCSGEGLCSDGGGGCGSKGSASPNVRLALSEIEAFLCYSCRILAAKLDHLPDFLEKEAGKKLRRAGMKHEIQDFLL